MSKRKQEMKNLQQKRMKFAQRLFAAGLLFTSLSAESCLDNHLIEDSGFDLWCGEMLCSWELLRGELRQGTTWHEHDYSVEFIGEHVEIRQRSSSAGSRCIRFELLTDIAENAQVILSMDFFSDGYVEYEQELSAGKWQEQVYSVQLPPGWNGVDFSLQKRGPGKAQFAQIEATEADSCVGELLLLDDRPLGSYCQSGEDCNSEICGEIQGL